MPSRTLAETATERARETALAAKEKAKDLASHAQKKQYVWATCVCLCLCVCGSWLWSSSTHLLGWDTLIPKQGNVTKTWIDRRTFKRPSSPGACQPHLSYKSSQRLQQVAISGVLSSSLQQLMPCWQHRAANIGAVPHTSAPPPCPSNPLSTSAPFTVALCEQFPDQKLRLWLTLIHANVFCCRPAVYSLLLTLIILLITSSWGLSTAWMQNPSWNCIALTSDDATVIMCSYGSNADLSINEHVCYNWTLKTEASKFSLDFVWGEQPEMAHKYRKYLFH